MKKDTKQPMDLIAALTIARRDGWTTATHYQGEQWDIDNLLGEIDGSALESSCEAGQWIIDGNELVHINDSGYRSGQYYVLTDYRDANIG